MKEIYLLAIGIFSWMLSVGSEQEKITTRVDSATFFINSIELVDSTGKTINWPKNGENFSPVLIIKEIRTGEKAKQHSTIGIIRINGGESKKIENTGIHKVVLTSVQIQQGEQKQIKVRLPKMEKKREVTYEFQLYIGKNSHVQTFKLTPPHYQDTINIRVVQRK